MFCTRCGHVLDENMQYCPECGKKQFDLPSDEKPCENGKQLFIISFAAAFAIVVLLNYIGGGIFTFLFLPFVFFGGKGGKMQYIVSGVCWGFICGALLSIVMKSAGLY